MRLIDAHAIPWRLSEDLELRVTKAAILEMPTVDAVPVVRCEDCIHWDDDPDTYGKDDGPKGKCMKSFEITLADDFCSHSERKEDT